MCCSSLPQLGNNSYMGGVDKLRKLREVTTGNGFTPHEVTTAQSLAKRLEKNLPPEAYAPSNHLLILEKYTIPHEWREKQQGFLIKKREYDGALTKFFHTDIRKEILESFTKVVDGKYKDVIWLYPR